MKYNINGTSQLVLVVKNLPASARGVGLIPGSGRSPGVGSGSGILPGECHR